jgi:hypothetical protein
VAQNRESSRRLTVAFTCARRQGLGDLLNSVRVSDPGRPGSWSQVRLDRPPVPDPLYHQVALRATSRTRAGSIRSLANLRQDPSHSEPLSDPDVVEAELGRVRIHDLVRLHTGVGCLTPTADAVVPWSPGQPPRQDRCAAGADRRLSASAAGEAATTGLTRLTRVEEAQRDPSDHVGGHSMRDGQTRSPAGHS